MEVCVGELRIMVECTNFPLDEDDCRKCKEYPCSIVRNEK
jgi:hypothetical protein